MASNKADEREIHQGAEMRVVMASNKAGFQQHMMMVFVSADAYGIGYGKVKLDRERGDGVRVWVY